MMGYAEDVTQGRKLANRYEILACQRFIDEYNRQKTDADYPFTFSFAKAWKVISFIEKLPHVKGPLANKPGPERLLKLCGFEIFIVANIFGWVAKSTGLRRFSIAYLRKPRKNNKSTLAAGIGLYMLCADGEAGAEVLCGATTLDQARKVFDPAKQMARNTPDLRDAYKLEAKEQFIRRPDGSQMQPLIGDPGDGGNPSCAIVDEYHEHDSDTLYETMITGMVARLQPLILVITTAGENLFSPCYAMDNMMRDILDGVMTGMDHIFTILYGIDPDDDWTDPQMLIKANPNYGRSVNPVEVEKARKLAVQNPGKQTAYKTKHLNIWCNEKNAYFNVLVWQSRHAKTMSSDDFHGKTCWIGLDLAKVHDMSAKVLVFREWFDGGEDVYGSVAVKGWHYFLFTRFYICEAQIYDSDNKALQMLFTQWRESGFLHVCDGNEQDFGLIRDEILADSALFSVVEVPHDPHGSIHLTHELTDAGLLPVKINQHGSQLTEPLTELWAAIESGRIHHDGNPVMSWCIGNVIVKEFPGGNKMPKKKMKSQKLTAFRLC
ncbi:terminase large subunit [Methylomonas sp. CM2]|uniref:terminase large subunit n=1 Tax=Methylomonas sp. CM2 TaxID=3417647 RepID=UPI003CEDB623